MKFFLIFALAVFGATAAPAADDTDVAEHVKEIVDKILEAIPDPLLDLHDQKANLDLGFETLDFTFIDVVLSGIKELEISTLTYDEDSGRLDYEFTLADVEADVEFDLLLAGILDADNHPVVKVALNNLKLAGYAVVDTSSDPHKVTDFKLLVTLEDSKVDLTGILNDDALTEKLEKVLNEQLPTIVNDIAVQLEPAVSPIIKSVLNILIRLLN